MSLSRPVERRFRRIADGSGSRRPQAFRQRRRQPFCCFSNLVSSRQRESFSFRRLHCLHRYIRLKASSSAAPVERRTVVTLIQVEDAFPPTTSVSSTSPPLWQSDSWIVILVCKRVKAVEWRERLRERRRGGESGLQTSSRDNLRPTPRQLGAVRNCS